MLAGSVAGFNAVVLEGEAGSGKTALWEESLHRAAGRGAVVLSARAAQSEVRLTYVALTDLLGSVATETFEPLPTPQRRALEAALLHAEPARGSMGQRAVATAFLTVVETLSRASTVLIAVDDAHWLDPATASLLEYAVRRLESQPVALLVTQRTGEAEPFPLDRACPRLVRVQIGGLGTTALQTMIRERLGSSLSRARLLEVERLSGGNPLFALELARTLAGRPADREPPTLPATLGEAMLTRIRSLPAPTRAALLVAASAAEPKVDFVDPTALAPAEEAAVVRIGREGSIAFTHPLFEWAVYVGASLAQRRAVHAALALQVESEEEQVRHLALATDGPNEDLATRLDAAARLARARGAPAAAAELHAQARRLTPVDDLDAWARRSTEEIPVLVEAGDWEEAWALGQEAIARLPAGPARALILLEAAVYRPGVAELCRQALEEAHGDPVIRIRAELALAQAAFYELDAAGALERAETAVALACEVGDRGLVAMTSTFLGIIRFLVGSGDPMPPLDEALKLEGELGAPVMQIAVSGACYRAVWLMLDDQAETARSVLAQLLQQAIETGDESSRAQLLSFLAVLELVAGNWPQARKQIEEAIGLVDLSELSPGRGEKRFILASVLAHQGELDAAREAVTEGIGLCEAAGDRVFPLGHLSVLGLIAVSVDEPEVALEHFDQVRERLSRGYDPPLWLDFEGDEIEALVAVGRKAEAEMRVTSLERRTGERRLMRLVAQAARGRGLLLASEGDIDGAFSKLDDALEQIDLEGSPFELARTLLVKGQLERRSKHKGAARVTLERAGQAFDELGAKIWAHKAHAELARLGIRHARAELSETERRVAKLVATSKTNRQIAAELFISRRTVESNVARVYRKLGVESRAGLATLMAGRELEVPGQRMSAENGELAAGRKNRGQTP